MADGAGAHLLAVDEGVEGVLPARSGVAWTKDWVAGG